MKTPRLSLAPVSYFWDREALYDYYRRIADTPVDIVYLGETICSKRRSLVRDDWLEIAAQLESSGKEAVLSTLALVEAESELATMQRICDDSHYMVEANDMAAVQMRSGNPRGFVCGPSINVYNTRSLEKLQTLGLKRWVMPVEHSREVLESFEIPGDVETEVFAWGRLPLAYSARCYTARTHNTPKDDCELRCLDYPDGLLLHTREDDPFLVLNGIQTQSALHHNLVQELGHPKIDVYRLSPQVCHSEEIIRIFHECLQGRMETAVANTELQKLAPCGTSNGYWFGDAGMKQLAAEAG
mgnify:CR=1 FL=1